MYRRVTRANKVILFFCDISVVRVCACHTPCTSFLYVLGIPRFVLSPRASETDRASRTRERGKDDEAENHVRATVDIREDRRRGGSRPRLTRDDCPRIQTPCCLSRLKQLAIVYPGNRCGLRTGKSHAI